jgi:hypothetical protein
VFQHAANAQQTCELAPDPAFFPQIEPLRAFARMRRAAALTIKPAMRTAFGRLSTRKPHRAEARGA